VTSAQHPIPSGFGNRSTPLDVLGDTDLAGRLAIVTGGYSGLGLETTRALATAGADVIVPARRPDHAREVLDELGDTTGTITVDDMDLAQLESVDRFAEHVVDSGRPIDIVVNNAAIMACPETRVGSGWEAQFATNHLAHFVLVNRLWPALVAGGASRVVSVSSAGHKLCDIRWDDIQFEQGYDKWLAYGQAKTANSLFAVQLDSIGQQHGVRAFAVHPGGIMTELQRHLPHEEMVAMGWMDADGNLNARFKSPEQGAATSVWTATSSQLDGRGGVYCEDCDIASPTDVGGPTARFMGVNDYAIDSDAAARLWQVSADLTGVDATA
jgi:NAD(P)-dependent dehydrogenase (short-subunit alcohol dehydrogenase family)